MAPRKKARETYGEGSITAKLDKDGNQRKNKQGQLCWLVQISLPGSDQNTKRTRLSRVVYGSIEDARKYKRKLLREYEHIEAKSNEMTFIDLVKKWEIAMRNSNKCAEHQLHRYITRLKRINEALPEKKLPSITAEDVETAISEVKIGLADSTAMQYFSLAKRVFRFATERELLARNPCDKLHAPKVKKKTTRFSLTAGEAAHLQACLDRDELATYEKLEQRKAQLIKQGEIFVKSTELKSTYVQDLSELSVLMSVRILLASGMRRGESLGLTWNEVDFERMEVKVVRTLNALMQLNPPKTDAGTRKISLDKTTMKHLKEWKEYQRKELHLIQNEMDGQYISITQTKDTPVCCSCTGDWLNPGGFDRWWNEYRVKIGFPNLKIHELRHTHATLLLSSGVPIKTVQERLGHADASVTLNTYAHAIPADDRAAASKVEEILNTHPNVIELKPAKTA